jgi:positive regulator of sigma E activity
VRAFSAVAQSPSVAVMLFRPEHLILFAVVVFGGAGYLLWAHYRDRSRKGDR